MIKIFKNVCKTIFHNKTLNFHQQCVKIKSDLKRKDAKRSIIIPKTSMSFFLLDKYNIPNYFSPYAYKIFIRAPVNRYTLFVNQNTCYPKVISKAKEYEE